MRILFIAAMVAVFSLQVFAGGYTIEGDSWVPTKKGTGTVDQDAVKKDAEPEKKVDTKKAQEERLAKIRKSEKRKPDELIYLALYRPYIDEKLKKSIDANKMFEMLAAEFKNDPVIRLVDQNAVDKFQTESEKQRFSFEATPGIAAHLIVKTRVLTEEQVGITKQGKLGKMTAIVFGGDIISLYLPEDRYDLKESGNIFANAQIIKNYASRIKDIVKTKPFIPGQPYFKALEDEEKAKKNGEGDKKKIDVTPLFKGLFGK